MKLSEEKEYVLPRLDEIPIRDVPSLGAATKNGRGDSVSSREPIGPSGPAMDRISGKPTIVHLAGRMCGSPAREYVVGDHVQCTLDCWLDGGRFGRSGRKQETRIRVSGKEINQIEIVSPNGTFRYEIIEDSETHTVVIVELPSPTDRGVSEVVFTAVRLFFLFVMDQYF